jgi:hypothetical protein
MRIVFLILISLLSTGVIAQVVGCKSHVDSLTHESVVSVPEINAQPVGGLQALGRAVGGKVRLPAAARETDFSGIFVAFIIDEKGKIKGERTIRNQFPETSAQVFEAVRSLSWKPATCQGKPVSSIFILPVRF